ncbi:Sda [Parasponia andersonii]|uniref:Protein SDA1 n=1 Tax=Parasponia andersonii TaxID=3476 RepID=A0A2P5B0I3_PARAD|nr:Sda [Parasponia andersonii]
MTSHVPGFFAESITASGRSSEKLSLPTLQSKMKCDPEGYEAELVTVYNQFKSFLEMFEQQAALKFSSVSGIANDPTVTKDLGDWAMFLAHVTPFYPKHLAPFPYQLADLLSSSARSIPSGLRCHLAQALILLINRKILDIGENLALFMELQTLGDRTLRKLAFSHVVHSIRRMNQTHKNEAKNRTLQNIIFPMLQQGDEAKAKRAFITLCELHRRKVWFDDRTANAICSACFHSSSRIMIASLSVLLDYEKIEDEDNSDASSDEDDMTPQAPQVVLSKQSAYKAHHTGTTSSKKKKQAKLQRAIRSMKKQQRLSSEKNTSNYYSPLNHLKDPQGFAEKLFSRLQTCNERFEVKMMMLKVIARTVGLHRLILLSFYPYLQKYVQPHQRDVTNLLAAAVQACHDMVPPDAVEPLFKQVVNQFVHDRSRPEAIAVGLNVIREICLRMPLLMSEDLLQDLALYKKSHEKAVSIAARSLIGLFREVCPSLLVKKDRGLPTDPKARPKAYGEVNVPSNVPGVELLDHDDDEDSDDMDEPGSSGSEDDHGDDEMVASSDGDEENQESTYDTDSEDGDIKGDIVADDDGNSIDDSDGGVSIDDDDDVEEEEDRVEMEEADDETKHGQSGLKDSNAKKRKLSEFDKQLVAADTSLRALKKLAGVTIVSAPPNLKDGILSNEDFQRIKELKAKKEAKAALTKHGLLRKGSDVKSTQFNVPNADQISVKRVDPTKLEAHVRRKLSKEERLALVRAGREDRERYQSRTAMKQKKTGGSSNRQKEHKKAMPLAAKKAKIARSQADKRKKQQRSGKQFRGKKAWK